MLDCWCAAYLSRLYLTRDTRSNDTIFVCDQIHTLSLRLHCLLRCFGWGNRSRNCGRSLRGAFRNRRHTPACGRETAASLRAHEDSLRRLELQEPSGRAPAAIAAGDILQAA